jgi:uncharacterized protein YacL
MTPLRTINLLRTLFAIFAALIGTMIGEVMMRSWVVGTMAGLVFGLVVVLIDRLLKGISLRTFSSATFGLLMGLLFSRLLLASDVLRNTSEDLQWMLALTTYCTFGYFGMMLAIRSNRDEFSLIIPYVRFQQSGVQDTPILVDTNIVIDGRIRELFATGFLYGSLVLPSFVLAELQRLADSAEPLKRERGRRGLELLRTLQDDPRCPVTVHESVSEEATPVDTRLVRLARVLGAKIITNDSSLCNIARLQNVTVLNLNELAKAMQSALSAGDQLEIVLTKEGRDAHQAVGYLGDGTMIVVNHARSCIGKTVEVTIAGTLQTSAGRLFFAELNRDKTKDPN